MAMQSRRTRAHASAHAIRIRRGAAAPSAARRRSGRASACWPVSARSGVAATTPCRRLARIARARRPTPARAAAVIAVAARPSRSMTAPIIDRAIARAMRRNAHARHARSRRACMPPRGARAAEPRCRDMVRVRHRKLLQRHDHRGDRANVAGGTAAA
ncbi:MAG: hypothetical protein WDW38_006493 [Sanguina aurantia]